jgi:hypothetical protein
LPDELSGSSLPSPQGKDLFELIENKNRRSGIVARAPKLDSVEELPEFDPVFALDLKAVRMCVRPLR